MKKLPPIGTPTEEERHFINYLSNSIADYIEKIPTERRTIICGLSVVCQIVFCKQTHFDTKEQCHEIDKFCKFLKSFAIKEAERN